MKTYNTPRMEIIAFTAKDVLNTSGDDDDDLWDDELPPQEPFPTGGNGYGGNN